MKRCNRLLKLYIAFFKVGLFTIGGGYAMLPIVERELGGEEPMATHEDILEGYSLAQTLPGVIASNAAALIGYKMDRKTGALVSVLGVITPSIFILIAIAAIFQKIGHYPVVQNAFVGIRIVVLALLIDSFTRLYKMAMFDLKTKIIGGVGFAVTLLGLVSPLTVIVCSAVIGFWIYRERVGS